MLIGFEVSERRTNGVGEHYSGPETMEFPGFLQLQFALRGSSMNQSLVCKPKFFYLLDGPSPV